METTPDKHCQWEVHKEYLVESLNEIHRSGSKIISIVPSQLEDSLSPFKTTNVTSYIIIYYNPPIQAVPGMPDSGDPATIQ